MVQISFLVRPKLTCTFKKSWPIFLVYSLYKSKTSCMYTSHIFDFFISLFGGNLQSAEWDVAKARPSTNHVRAKLIKLLILDYDWSKNEISISIFNQSQARGCPSLLCLACNLGVVSEDNVKWDEETDYLFLRNNVPNMAKLRGVSLIETFNLQLTAVHW